MFIRRRNSPVAERGAAAVEFALIVPALLLLIFGIADFSWVFNQQVSLSNAAREASRYYAVHEHSGGTPAQAVAWGKNTAPTINAATWSAASTVFVVSQGCDPTKAGYDSDPALTGKVLARIEVPVATLTGFFESLLTNPLKAKGMTVCGG